MLAKIIATTGLVSAGLLLIIFTTTTPTSAGALGILAIFLLSYVFVLSVTTFALWLIMRLVVKVMGRIYRSTKSSYDMTLKRAYYFSTVIALGPVIIVSMRSVGSVGIYEVGLVTIFIALGCLYVSRRTI